MVLICIFLMTNEVVELSVLTLEGKSGMIPSLKVTAAASGEKDVGGGGQWSSTVFIHFVWFLTKTCITSVVIVF